MRHSASVGTAIMVSILAAWGIAHAGGLQITAQGIAPGGGSSVSPGGCRHLDATFGEPVTGRASGGAYTVIAGFQAGIGAQRDSIFRDGFQECQ